VNNMNPFKKAWTFLKNYNDYLQEQIKLPTFEELNDIHEHHIYPHESTYMNQLQYGRAGPQQENAYRMAELRRQQNKCLFCERKAEFNMGTDEQECWQCNSAKKSRNAELAQQQFPQEKSHLGLTEEERGYGLGDMLE
tara:strand:+ start:994 stop:1407 length:414 start_codon:yes stop_codon:yes gene_type:complete